MNTYIFAEAVSKILNLDFEPTPTLSDEQLYLDSLTLDHCNVPGVYALNAKQNFTQEQKNEMTKAANATKLGMKESELSCYKKSISQKRRWDMMSKEDRAVHGIISAARKSKEGKNRSVIALKTSYSPQREKNRAKDKVKCPHCNIIGGIPIMHRFHFDRCKNKIS